LVGPNENGYKFGKALIQLAPTELQHLLRTVARITGGPENDWPEDMRGQEKLGETYLAGVPREMRQKVSDAIDVMPKSKNMLDWFWYAMGFQSQKDTEHGNLVWDIKEAVKDFKSDHRKITKSVADIIDSAMPEGARGDYARKTILNTTSSNFVPIVMELMNSTDPKVRERFRNIMTAAISQGIDIQNDDILNELKRRQGYRAEVESQGLRPEFKNKWSGKGKK
jgi:hypothetical protein